jgi:hypothetical protein
MQITTCFPSKNPAHPSLRYPLTPNPHTTHNPSQYHHPLLLLLPPPSSILLHHHDGCLPHYSSNVTIVYPVEDDNKLSDLFDAVDEVPDIFNITQDIQNWASCHIGSMSMKALLFYKFFRTSMRAVEIL